MGLIAVFTLGPSSQSLPYFVQAVKNLKAAEETLANGKETTRNMFDGLVDDEPTAAE